MCRDRVILVMIIHGCYLYLFIILYFKYISFYILKVFHHGHLLLLDIVKHDIKNSYKRKCFVKIINLKYMCPLMRLTIAGQPVPRESLKSCKTCPYVWVLDVHDRKVSIKHQLCSKTSGTRGFIFG